MHAYIAITDEDGRLQEKLMELQASFNGQFIPAQETGTVSYLYKMYKQCINCSNCYKNIYTAPDSSDRDPHS